ncbi:trafficking protein particle complex subunit 2-like protein isoform X2 [Juglans microcarpa x Juglans regia]|uniref:trafficking protein particle complex subunit 2-like protein isoform X2 n=1 Tax=Juglans microcarpa x Juglans regia TaxID=2249226 RepID=UPI001B7EB413|nr:trafficking protein particle complex subunit 2-like protein isoform X2 [Juglans microcarpa x Juglans regia]XP_041014493.1 trafficking protein particle complex subunit 2-like protein isoform X2 [Juglans microcarpa x Juglans regia]
MPSSSTTSSTAPSMSSTSEVNFTLNDLGSKSIIHTVQLLVNNPKKSGPTLNETFLGLLYPTENYKVYGYLTNTKVKFIVVTTDLDVRDADVRNFFRRFHAAYVDAVSNPFHVPGKKITSRAFAERVSTIVKSFGLSSAG